MKFLLKNMIKEKSELLGREINIALIGLGATNKALLSLISNFKSSVNITVIERESIGNSVNKSGSDDGKKVEVSNHTLPYSPQHSGISEFDFVFPSPSIRREKLAPIYGTAFLTDYDLLFALKPKNLFLVSGSDGKSTTVDMASRLLSPTFPDIFTGGNIGTPLWLASLKSEAFLLELSSFTLCYSKPRNGRALITNITPNHLDWHASLEEYQEAKLSLLKAADEPILNLDDEVSKKYAEGISAFCLVSLNMTEKEIRARYITLNTVTLENGFLSINSTPVVSLSRIANKEKHNLYNLAFAVALTIGYTDTKTVEGLAESYKPLAERCEVINARGVRYVSSSIDTTPERTKATLSGLDSRVRIILGGRGKGLSLEPLRNVLKKYADKIAVYGEVGREITEFIDSDDELKKIPHAAFKTFDEAIDYATDGVKVGNTVLLSPAATSYGEFADYKERGAHFKNRIKSIGNL